MKINNIDIIIQDTVCECFDRTVMLSPSNSDKVLVLNETASIIWKYIHKCNEKNLDVSTDDIIKEIENVYNLQEAKHHTMRSDIEEILQKFLLIGLFVEKS